ncbi:uncharacterized protein LOC124931102 [Impatiens glandulifera]|uniref:uncharacterized protein LOC124931102 n=1 Tax=Impatiens glandulifera TaxID=253017 RepID=UPI001FB06650|nr:uncharacterized protein LOC124931102 [Impatiens glandulifera]
MADKPSRGLVLYGDGLAPFLADKHTHLHSFASRAFCGFLSLPNSPPSENEDARVIREFAQLVDACDSNQNACGEEGASEKVDQRMPVISERFMGMKCAIITNNSALRTFGVKLGLKAFELSEFIDVGHPISDTAAGKLLNLLGFEEGKVSVTSSFDLVFVHIGGDNNNTGEKYTENVNGLVGSLVKNIDEPDSEIGLRLHLSILMSYGTVVDADDSFSVLKSNDSDLSRLLQPSQSYTMRGRNLRSNVRHHYPILIGQWQNAVTRKDGAKGFCFKQFKDNGGMLTIPADRFIHEVAFKLWKTPKYGA